MTASRNRELGDFLRSCRARVEPLDVGLPYTDGRRVRGLRREEVAHLAGVSPDYYTRLEQGRQRTASPQVLDSLTTALRLTTTNKSICIRSPEWRVWITLPSWRPGLSTAGFNA
ncbi:helix-turn-helix domain-containing protein [Kribbella qitaiheensis]|uniref:helix-turn-helix domain-containing protein n=1 Tax=Kribbella qitaiheensis TaxID=1544730 RepID=UPI00360C4394